MIGTIDDLRPSHARSRYLQLVHDLMWRYRLEVVQLSLDLEEAERELAQLESLLAVPDGTSLRDLRARYDEQLQRIEITQDDLACAREAARGAEEEYSSSAGTCPS